MKLVLAPLAGLALGLLVSTCLGPDPEPGPHGPYSEPERDAVTQKVQCTDPERPCA